MTATDPHAKTKSSRYEIILYWSETDDCFIAEVPELPGCMADGGARQEAIAHAEIGDCGLDRDREGAWPRDSSSKRPFDFRLIESTSCRLT